MKKHMWVVMVSCLMTTVLFLAAGTVIAAADSTQVPADKAGAGLVILAMLLVGLLLALGVIRIMAGSMSTIRKQDSAKGYGQDLMLTEKSDVYLYSHTTSRQVQ
jgi:hypothetical protein